MRRNTRSSMSPTQSNGRESDSSHTGLNPLFFTTPVRTVVARAEEALPRPEEEPELEEGRETGMVLEFEDEADSEAKAGSSRWRGE